LKHVTIFSDIRVKFEGLPSFVVWYLEIFEFSRRGVLTAAVPCLA